jgi:predicted MPP superfamily phosphohydrolase
MKYRKIIIALLLFIQDVTGFAQCGVPDVNSFGTLQTNTTSSPYWSPVSGASSYNFRYRIRNAGLDYSNPVNVTDTLTTLNSLTPLTNYEFIVQADCSGDTGVYSSAGWFTTLSNQAEQITRGPFMTVPSDGTITIQWSTNVPCNSEVRYGISALALNEVANNTVNTQNHSLTLTHLSPNTKYYYSVGTIGNSLQEGLQNYFQSSPAVNDSVPMRFWVTGDFGTGTSSQFAVRNSFVSYNQGQPVNGWLWLGDNAYGNGLESEYTNKVFNVYPDQMKNIPLFPALGNHDYAQSGYLSTLARGTDFPYFNIFNLPTASGTEKYYSANYGNIHFIALDSYGSYNTQGSAMYNWLQNDLMHNDRQWTIVYFHHPPYSKGSHDSDLSDECIDMRTHIIPLLESYGVDLVLSGHSHAYERSKFIHGHYGQESTFGNANVVQQGGGPYSKASRTGQGTMYIVCGVAGQTEGTTAGWPHNAMFYSTTGKLGSLVIDIEGGLMSCKFVTSTGTIEDQFSMSKPPVEVPTLTADVSSNENKFFIAPNPAKEEFTVISKGLAESDYTLSIYNTFGQIVFKKEIAATAGNRIATLSKSELRCAAGLYYVTLQNERGKSTCALVIE